MAGQGGASEPINIQMTTKKANSSTAKISNSGETEKRVLFNGVPEYLKWYIHVWNSLPETDIVSFAQENELPFGEHAEKGHPFFSPCELRTVVVSIPDSKMEDFYLPFENHIVAGRYCAFFLGLITNGPVSKNVQTWQLGKQTLVIIENEMVILMEVIGKTAAEQETKSQDQLKEQ